MAIVIRKTLQMNRILLFILFISGGVNAQHKFTVYFDSDKDRANIPSARDFEQWISANKDATILTISGHADTVGKKEYNLALSVRRDLYVIAQMAANGINTGTADVQPYGESESFSADKANDRRVDIYYTKPAPPPVAEAAPKRVETNLTRTITTAGRGDKLRLPNLNFYNHSATMLPQSEPVLNELLKVMQDNPDLKIDIQGHICCQLQEINNISTKRAKAVHDFLLKNGIAQNRISFKGLSSKRPLYKLPEKNEEERIANRRVEIEILQN
jgi:outer membrane protein OmpA-like peptidoglycan-associated protein